MKKILMSVIASASILMAGGNISTVAPVSEAPSYTGLYVGAGLGSTWTYTKGDFDFSDDTTKSVVDPAIGLRVGYNFWQYGSFVLGTEGRLTASFDADDTDVTSYEVFVKPEYFVTPEFSVYGLAGYGWTRWNEGSAVYKSNGFAGGLGVGYKLTKDVSVSADWVTSVWNKDLMGEKDLNNDKVMVWLNYKF